MFIVVARLFRVRSLVVAAGFAACLSAVAAAPFEDSIAQRVLACTGCHGAAGRAAPDGYYPRIAGKPAGYLLNQLRNFRDGRRDYALMTGLLAPLTDTYLGEIAEHFAALELPYPAPVAARLEPAAAARAAALARDGDAARGLPACAACHGSALTGIAPFVPGLVGLPRDYLNAQLGAWRTGKRVAQAPDCMAQIARALSPDDVVAISGWLRVAARPARRQGRARLRRAAADALRRRRQRRPRRRDGRRGAPLTRTLVRVAVGVALALGIAVALVAWLNVRGEAPLGDVSSDTAAAPVDAATLARGAYLVRAGSCIGCHTARGGVPFAGGRPIETPFGAVYSTNLTPDRGTGIGAWSADAFWRAMRHGRSRDGRLLYPVFPYPSYTRVTRADADAMHAWLMRQPAVAQANRPHALAFPFDTQAALAVWRALYFRPASHADDARQSADWNRGAYLVDGLGHCNACHSARNAFGATVGSRYLEGGLIPEQNWYAPSLASPDEAGVAAWPVDDVVRLLKTGVAERGVVAGPMAEVVLQSTQHLSDADLRAMATYLQSLRPSREAAAAQAPGPAVQPTAGRGAALYREHCAGCHGERGEGVAGAYPALAGNRAVTLTPVANLVHIVREGGFAPATAGNPRPYGMPPFATVLSDDDIAVLLTYLRASWGNRGAPVSALQVLNARSGSG